MELENNNMSNENEDNKKKNRRYIGKLKTINGKYGPMQKIYVENPDHLKKDGSPNPYFKGALVWYDANGTGYKIKQMSVWVPKEGMSAEQVQQGFSCFITLNLDDNYEVEIIA